MSLLATKFRRVFNEGFWVILGQFFAITGSIFSVRILTNLLPADQYGELSLGLTVATLINQVLLGPLGEGVLRFYSPAIERGDVANYFCAVKMMLNQSLASVISLMLLCMAGLILFDKSYWISILIAAIGFAFINGTNAIANGIQNAARHRSVVALHQGIEAWSRLLFTFILINLFGSKSSLAMWGYFMGGAITFSSQWLYFHKSIPRSTKSNLNQINTWKNQIWLYSWPIATFGIFTWGQLISDRWALGIFANTHQLGMYAVLYQLGYYPISIATGLAIQFLSPILFQQAGDASDPVRNASAKSLTIKLTYGALAITVAFFVIGFFLHKQIFSLLTTKDYSEVSYLLPWIIVSGGLTASAQTISLDFLSQKRTKTIMSVKITTAIIGSVLNIFGVIYFGIMGIVVAGIIFSSSYFFWILILSRAKVSKIS